MRRRGERNRLVLARAVGSSLREYCESTLDLHYSPGYLGNILITCCGNEEGNRDEKYVLHYFGMVSKASVLRFLGGGELNASQAPALYGAIHPLREGQLGVLACSRQAFRGAEEGCAAYLEELGGLFFLVCTSSASVVGHLFVEPSRHVGDELRRAMRFVRDVRCEYALKGQAAFQYVL